VSQSQGSGTGGEGHKVIPIAHRPPLLHALHSASDPRHGMVTTHAYSSTARAIGDHHDGRCIQRQRHVQSPHNRLQTASARLLSLTDGAEC